MTANEKEQMMIDDILDFMRLAGDIARGAQNHLDASANYLKAESVTSVVTAADLEISQLFRQFVARRFDDTDYVIIDEDARKKMVCVDPNDIPAVAIVDPELMYSMPKGLTAATGMDALTHAIESYITPGAWVMSDMFELKAIEMIAQNLKAAVDNGKDVAAREAMSQAQYIAGMGFSNVGLGIVHSMAHPLGAFYDTPHGVANALLLPYVMEYNAESPAAPKYIHIAKAMGVDTTGMSEAEGVKAAVEAVKALSASINIPQKLHEINVKEEDIPALAVAAFNDVCTGGNPRPTSVADIEALYRKAF